VSTPITWDEVADVRPARLHDRDRAGALRRLGDLHAGIDDAVFVIAPCFGGGARDEAVGAEHTRPADESPTTNQPVLGTHRDPGERASPAY
jgi:hypothetical protein